MKVLDIKITLYEDEIEMLQAFVDYKNSISEEKDWTFELAAKVLFIHRLEDRYKDIAQEGA